jgi:GNAT superfamily N-acetyltransferase
MTREPCQLLQWDTEFFGVRVGSVKGHRLDFSLIEAILDWCRGNDIDCLYFLADSDHAETVRIAEDYAFRFRDIRMTFSRKLDYLPAPETIHGLICRPVQPGDLEHLRPVARTAYVHTRFYYDPCFAQEKSSALYDTWLVRSIAEGYADGVMVAEMEGRPVGYVTAHLSHQTRIGQIGLVGIAEDARGQRIGHYLLNATLDWFARQGMVTVEVRTHGRNIPAQRLYQKCGFVTESVRLWYHKWFKDCQ